MRQKILPFSMVRLLLTVCDIPIKKILGALIRMVKVIVVLIALSLASQIGAGHAQVNVGVSVGQDGLRGFYLAIGEYYSVPQREVIVVRERRIPPEEIPVVFFIAQRARVAPALVIDLRLRGNSWWDISIQYGLGPEVYYVPIPALVKLGPPYGKAYGHYKNKPKEKWKTIVLNDAEVVNLVNLKFVSEHYRRPPDEVIRLRSGGKDFVVINHDIRKGAKSAKFANAKDADQGIKKQQKSKGK
jgi:hypothetical protein